MTNERSVPLDGGMRQRREVLLLSFVYMLYVLLITAPVGVVISAIKAHQLRKRLVETQDEADLVAASHHEWLTRTFVGMLVMSMAALGTLYYSFGFVIAAVAVVWWFYRLGRGVYALWRHQPLPTPVCTDTACYSHISKHARA